MPVGEGFADGGIMKRKSRVLNGILVLILLVLLGWGADRFLHPKFPATVEGDDIVPAPRELKIPALARRVYSNAVVKDVTRLNLFRKQRTKYYRPKPPKPKPRIKPAPPKVALAPPPPPLKPTAPPPQLVLTGVLLFDGQQVAIFEGTYSEIRGGRLVQNLKPRRRGYKIGESLGGYKIITIGRSRATLSAITGNHLTLSISKTPPTQKIQKSGNRLTQKSKPVANNFSRMSPARRTQRSQRVPIQKRPKSRIPPLATSPPAVSNPGTKVPVPKPLNLNRLQRLRQKSMGF
jgi:hypothetical protein